MTDIRDGIGRGLATAAALAEQGFLAAGQRLEEAIGILDRLTARFALYVADLTGDALAETRRNLAAAGTHVTTLAATRASDTAALRALGEIIAAAGTRVADLQPIIREVETLSLSARVVAGGMGDAAIGFSAFAADMRAAVQRARACVDGAENALGQAAAELTAAHAAAQAFAQQHGRTMQDIPPRLAANLHSLTLQQRRAADAAAAAHEQSGMVRRQVAAQIVALQLGDITRQRLEHVHLALQLLPDGQGHAGDLLAAQLADAADELLRGGSQIEAGLQELALAARAIGQLGVRLHGGSGGGFIAALEADIRQTAALFTALGAADAANDQRMATVRSVTSNLAERLSEVHEVQEDLRITGLNASLKCGRLGTAGRPLAAVALELRVCGTTFEAIAMAVQREIGRLRPITDALCDQSRHGEHTELAEAMAALLVPLQQLHRLEHDLTATLAQLHTGAAEVGMLVEAAVTNFAVRHALAAKLRQSAALCAAWPPARRCTPDLLDRIAAGYTMAREREVHARFAPLPQAQPAVAEAEAVLF